MRAIWPILVVCLTLVTPAAASMPARVTVMPDRVEVALDVPAPTFAALNGGLEPRIDGWATEAEAPGAPRLPVRYVTVVLPPGTRVTGVDAEGHATALPGVHRITWGQAPQPIGAAALPRTAPDARIYGSDATYPAGIARVAGSGFFRGYRLATVAVRPLQVRPLSGAATLWVDLRLTLRLAPDAARPAARPRALASDVADLAALAANPETAYAYGAPEAGRSADVPWLVVTPEALAPAFERLREHRTAHGLSGDLLTMERVRAEFAGRDDAERLRAAIARWYADHGTTFVLLGGDDFDAAGAPLVPARHCADLDDMASDWYFGALDGDWDTNANGRFCEPDEIDYYTEVHVGRATVGTLDEANRWIDKVLLFEAGLPEERRADVVFMGERLDDSTWGEDSKERIAPMVTAPHVIDRLYARNETFSAGAVVAALNRGPQLANHDGHANNVYVMGIGIPEVQALVNPTPFVAYSIGCDSGAWDQEYSGPGDAISEHFLMATHGAAAVVMNSRYGWYYVGWNAGLSAELDYAFFRALFEGGVRTFGEANDRAREDNAGTAMSDGTMRYCFLETNLHGDPAMPAQLRRNQLVAASVRVVDTDPAYANGNGQADPRETVGLAISLLNGGDAAATGVTARLSSGTPGVTVHDASAAWPDVPPGATVEGATPWPTATVDAPCGTLAAFRLEVHHDGLVDVSTFTVPVGCITDTTFRNWDFETTGGWTTGGDAKQGLFVREDPNPTTHAQYGVVQPDDDHSPSGTQCWVTGNPPAGSDPSTGDVNAGTTWIHSPVFDGTGGDRLLLRFARWFTRTNVGTGNYGVFTAKVTADDGAHWTEIEHLEATVPRWTTREIDLSAYVTPSTRMRLRFDAFEKVWVAQTGLPLVEVLVDDVSLVRRSVTCAGFEPGETRAPNAVGDTVTGARDGADVLLAWAEPAADAGHDPARFFPVYRARAATSGFAPLGEPTRCAWRDAGAADAAYGTYFYRLAARNAAGTSGEEPGP